MRESERRRRNNRIRRNRQLRRRILGTISALCMVFLLAVCFGSTSSSAHEENDTVYFKYFESIQVEEGDTLTSIAQEYADFHYTVQEYISEVVSINHLESQDMITAGQYIVVPYYSSDYKY